MYPEALSYLRCPHTHDALSPLSLVTDDTGEIIAGQLSCVGCGASFLINDGITDFLGPPRPTTQAQAVNELPLTAWAYERVWRPFALTLLSGEQFPYRRELPLIANLAAAERGGLFVDVACSNGLYARALTRARRGAEGHVIGIDHSMAMLREARRFAREARLRITYARAEAQALPIASDAASGVVIGGSLNEIGDLDGCLAEAKRVLSQGGRFVTMTLAVAHSQPGRLLQRSLGAGGIVFYDPDHLVEHFQNHGIRTVLWEQHGIVLFTVSIYDT